MTFAPSLTASFSAAPRLAKEFELASTSRMLQFGQIACAVSTSRAISSAQPEFGRRVARAACLVHLAEPGARAGIGVQVGEAEGLVVRGEVARDVRVVVGVDDRDRRRRRGGRGQVVAAAELRRAVGAARRRARSQRHVVGVGDDLRPTGGEARARIGAGVLEPVAPPVVAARLTLVGRADRAGGQGHGQPESGREEDALRACAAVFRNRHRRRRLAPGRSEEWHRRRTRARRDSWPRVESNHRTELRRLPLCPLSYGAEPWKPSVRCGRSRRPHAASEGGERDSNPRPPGPQPGALPTELPPPCAAHGIGAAQR